MTHRKYKFSILALAACLAQNPASAIPEGGAVVRGGVTFHNQGNLLTITNTPGAIIDWQRFNIAPGETTRFVQQGPTSSVLNRIVGQDPSQILGALQSNGRVFLVNPNGIVFGAGAQVDVGGLVASSLNIANDDFTAGRRIFDANAGSAASVRNQGAITTPAGGQVYLIAPNVENTGIVTSPRGEVLLAAGRHVQLVDSANPDLHVVVSAPEDRALNIGRILAQGGSVGIYGALVSQRGIVNADSAVLGENGRIVLRASDTTLLESGSVTSARGAGEGGTIHVLGDHVGLTGDAQVDASGGTGGGTVLVGGDFHGANAALANASATYLGAQTSIRADAIASGDGGRVAVWSDGATRAYGRISARGGSQSGNGGFAEVSGRGFLDYGARTDLRAARGTAGMLLLDPNDVTIQNGPSPATDIPVSDTPPFLFSGGPASSILTVADLQAQLAMGSVTVSTSGGSGGPNGGTITVANALAWTNGFSLTLDADNGIAINGAITAQQDGRLLLNSRGGTITQAAAIGVTYFGVTSLGDVVLNNAGNMVTAIAAQVGDATHLNHNFSFVNGQSLLVHNFSGLSGISIATSGAYSAGAPDGVITLRTTSGDITQTGGSLLSGKAVSVRGDNVTLNEMNPAGVVGGGLNGSGNFAYTSATDILSTGIQASSGNVSLASGGSIGGSVNAASIIANAGNGIALTTQAGSISAANSGGNAGISITNNGTLALQDIVEGGSGAITIDNTGALAVALGHTVSTTTGNISLTAHSPLTIDGAVNSTGGGAITLAAGPSGSAADQLTINGSIATAAAPGVAVSTTGAVLLRAGDAINISGTVAGNVTQQQFLNVPLLPTLAQCVANPTLAGCSAVLPTMATCIASPSAPGCSVVLPTLAQCTANANLPGCFVVLPTLAQCTATPTLPGCSSVLPTLGACVAAPGTPGCATVLPSIATCIAAPSTAGCTVILPTIAQCTANTGLPGCTVVLPTLGQCAATPSLPGCVAVLPNLATCIATPTLPGCASILPSLTQCIAAPALAGCSAVLPPMASCIANPALPGCGTVLPSLAACASNPGLAGCSAVLPSIAACTTNPVLPGCSAVLPSVATCISTPSAAGCAAVLPTLATCVTTPTLPGCNVVLPPVTVCLSDPLIAGCVAVLPPTQGLATGPVAQAVNTTVRVINSVTPSTTPALAGPPNTTGGPAAPASGTADDKKADDKKADDKKDVATKDDVGIKKEDNAKKMYCN